MPKWNGRLSNKIPPSAICWSRHSNSDYWQIAICVFLWSIKCQYTVWQQRRLYQRCKVRTLIGGRQGAASREPNRWLQLAPEHTAGSRIHQSTAFIGRFSRLIPTVNCAVTSDLMQNGYFNSWKSYPACHIQSGRTQISPVNGKPAGSGWLGWITVQP